VLQVPAPSRPQVVVQGDLNAWELALILIIVLAGVVAIAWPFLRSLARRFERPAAEPEVTARLDQLEGRLRQVRRLKDRVSELEERLEFAERLLPRPAGQSREQRE
jgi:hypothetical protein